MDIMNTVATIASVFSLGVAGIAGYAVNTQGMNAKVDLINNAVDLDWKNFVTDKDEPYTYTAYQKKEGKPEFQSISATDFNKKVKVLNVYPKSGGDITYTTWDGTKRILPQAGSAEQWMEEPNAKNAKGYGMGLIDLDPLEIDTFSSNPDSYLKDSKGNWKYDVVFFGSWDSNGSKDISLEASNLMIEFVKSGRGLLIGHDAVASGYTGPTKLKNANFARLLSQMNIEKLPDKHDSMPIESLPLNYQVWGSNNVVLTKKGLLTSFPWAIGDVGKDLKIPYAHTGWLINKGDRWMKFKDIQNLNTNVILRADAYMKNENVEMNSYLSTWSNTAMIQTGHSNGLATHDEQMVIANTLFYLAQLTNKTELKDRSGMDVAPPTKPVNVKITESPTDLTVSMTPSTDKGSAYSYYVIATGGNTGKTKKSNTVSVENKSDLAGYSYVIDNKKSTMPDEKIETTNPNFDVALKGKSGEWIHIAAVDKAGNLSEPFHFNFQTLFLNATVDHVNNAIDLDWNELNGNEPFTYKAFQQKEGNPEFQSISATDYSKKVRVLEVYPYVSVLKDWTNKFGKNTITTDSMTNEAFNENPSRVWDYDVVLLGFADSNNKKTLSDKARIEVEKFVDAGHGLLLGHDTVYVDSWRENYKLLAEKYLNMEARSTGGWYNGAPTRESLTSDIVISKKGLLTNYPWAIGDVGTKLTIPYDHTSYQYAKGDIWMRFNDVNQVDPNNFYLTTWNNVAMIQTGHSIRSTNASNNWATEDEQKLVTNTLFYLSQLTTETKLKDRSGMDVASPVIKSKPIANFDTATRKLALTIPEVTDKGSLYKYYVEGTGQNTNDTFTSNTVSIENQSGVAGYSYVFDNKKDTIPDNSVETTSKTLSLSASSDKPYLHIVAVDKAGNISEAYHYDTKPPELTTSEIKNVTQDGYDVYINGISDEFGKIASVQFPTWTTAGGQDDINSHPYPISHSSYNKTIEGTNLGNGTWKYHVNRSQHKDEFGEYMTHVYIYDDSGNIKVQHVPYVLRDTVKPVITIEGIPSQWTGTDVKLTIKGYDMHTGIKSMTLPNGSVVQMNGKKGETVSLPFSVQSNGSYVFTVTDYYGNTDTLRVSITKIDTTFPALESVVGNPTDWTNKSITVSVKAKDLESGIQSILHPDGSSILGATTNYSIHKNGDYIFIIMDNAGNRTETNVKVTRIDKIVPTEGTNSIAK